jgi:mono/diheme cytochrome c family protein
MKAVKITCLVAVLAAFLSSFFYKREGEKPVPVLPSPQRVGDAAKGYDYLITGDYVRSGLPLSLFLMAGGRPDAVYLQRTGANAKLSYEYTAVTAPNGKVLVAPNCLQCHAQVFDGELYIGLGNTSIDFSDTKKLNPKKLQAFANFLKTASPKNWEGAKPFLTVTGAISPYLKAEVPGVNMADRLAAVLAAHRDPQTFAWLDTPQLTFRTKPFLPIRRPGGG